MSEPWWTPHWDVEQMDNIEVPYEQIKRWRRGPLLTVYRFKDEAQTQWWFYGPFNLAIGFAYDRRKP